MSALAERYAEAIFRQTQSVEMGDQLVREMVLFLHHMDTSPPLARLLSDPSLKQHAPGVITSMADKLGLSPLCTKVVLLALERNRLFLLNDIGRALARRTDKAAGRLRAHVQVAVPLSDEQVARIESVLAKRFGKPVIADVQVQAQLLGGMLCRIGRLTFDGSLKKQFAQFAEQVGANAV